MKKLSAALLCTTLLFAVSGCIPSETSDGPVSSDKPEIQLMLHRIPGYIWMKSGEL